MLVLITLLVVAFGPQFRREPEPRRRLGVVIGFVAAVLLAIYFKNIVLGSGATMTVFIGTTVVRKSVCLLRITPRVHEDPNPAHLLTPPPPTGGAFFFFFFPHLF